MKVGYVRISRAGPSEAEQTAALREAGIDDLSRQAPVFIDRPKEVKGKSEVAQLAQREKAISSLRRGDILVVASAGRLGTTPSDLLVVLEAIADAGASIHDVAVGENIAFHHEVIAALAFLERAREEERRQILAKARAQKAALGAHRGPPVKLNGKAKEKAREAWEDITLTVQDVVKLSGVSEATLRRAFGPKGTPRFGRSDKTSNK